jgi:hypothetical protein
MGGSKKIIKTFKYPFVILLTYSGLFTNKINPPMNPIITENKDSFKKLSLFLNRVLPNLDIESNAIKIRNSWIDIAS